MLTARAPTSTDDGAAEFSADAAAAEAWPEDQDPCFFPVGEVRPAYEPGSEATRPDPATSWPAPVRTPFLPPEGVIRGRLGACAQFWHAIGAGKMILTWLLLGLPLFFKAPPPSEAWFASNHTSCFESPERIQFVTAAVASLCTSGAAHEVPERSLVCSPLGVAQHARTGKLRLIHDQRVLNQWMEVESFRYEGIDTIRQVARQGDCAFSFDLKSAYHHVGLYPPHWKYQGFEWLGKYYEFCSMPFGTKQACWCFTRLVKHMATHWRRNGIRVARYIDDWIFFCRPEAHAECVARVRADIVAAGWVINDEKCHGLGKPTSVSDFIGHTLDLHAGTISMMAQHKSHVRQMAADMAPHRTVTALSVARFVGKIASTHHVTGVAARIKTWHLRSLIPGCHERWHFRRHVNITAAAKTELHWWLENLERVSTTELWPSSLAFQVHGHSDAGEEGWGGHISLNGETLFARGDWNPLERTMSSTWRELQGLILVLASFVDAIRGKRIALLVDNLNGAIIWRSGASRNREHAKFLSELWDWCTEHDIHVAIYWLPRAYNALADHVARLTDRNDWKLNDAMASYLCSRWGNPAVDLFASHRNRQLFCRVFYSRWWCPGTGGVDSFTFDWGQHDLCWANPPFDIIGRVLRHAQACRARLIIILPAWRSAVWWPVISPRPSVWAPFVRDAVELPAAPDLFFPASSGSAFGVGKPNFDCWALLCDFSRVAI